jgi:hypothetical protein
MYRECSATFIVAGEVMFAGAAHSMQWCPVAKVIQIEFRSSLHQRRYALLVSSSTCKMQCCRTIAVQLVDIRLRALQRRE